MSEKASSDHINDDSNAECVNPSIVDKDTNGGKESVDEETILNLTGISRGSKEEIGAIAGEASAKSHRSRNDSESNENNFCKGKRYKQDSHSFSSGIAASPPKFVSLEEIMSATTCLNNMALAHEIAVDKDFKLRKLEPDDGLQKEVKETVHKVFWDLLSQQLKEDPPDYSQAMILLREIKESLLILLLPHHTKIKQEIIGVLDVELIEQQTKAGVLDFQHYAHYVISVMGKLCAPVRDQKIKQLTQMSDVVEVFRGILETLELMRLDMANFTIEIFRPNIIAKSVEYEKQKFAEYLKIRADGLQFTRQWLLSHLETDKINFKVEDVAAVKSLTAKILAEGYLELLEWDSSNPYPETLVMDENRFLEIEKKFLRLTVMGAILLVTISTSQALQGIASFKEELKDHTMLLLQDTNNKEELEKVMPNVVVQIIKDVNDCLEKHGFNPLDETCEKSLEGQILEISKPDHKIRQLVCVRVKEFLLQSITSPTAAPMKIPPGLSSLQAELTSITGHFIRLVSHNRAVFGEHYINIVTLALSAHS